tara:strand:- start:503 stop:982 length:480 start_codon:yes stop_codon:yes gene_type:complete
MRLSSLGTATLMAKDGESLGASYNRFLEISATEEGAFTSWVNKYSVMNEVVADHKFFKPLMLTIGKEIKTSATKLKLFYSVGASMASLTDVAFDLYAIQHFRSRTEAKFHFTADLMLTFVLLSIGLQVSLHTNKTSKHTLKYSTQFGAAGDGRGCPPQK